jgi:hypothetical protein
MKLLPIFVAATLISSAAFADGPPLGTVCVAPIPAKPPSTAATEDLFCLSGKLSLKFDGLPTIFWPRSKSLTINSLDATVNHKVLVLCEGKPQQSFKFRFSQFKESKLCLYINDLYQIVELQEAKKSPWCKCN